MMVPASLQAHNYEPLATGLGGGVVGTGGGVRDAVAVGLTGTAVAAGIGGG